MLEILQTYDRLCGNEPYERHKPAIMQSYRGGSATKGVAFGGYVWYGSAYYAVLPKNILSFAGETQDAGPQKSNKSR